MILNFELSDLLNCVYYLNMCGLFEYECVRSGYKLVFINLCAVASNQCFDMFHGCAGRTCDKGTEYYGSK